MAPRRLLCCGLASALAPAAVVLRPPRGARTAGSYVQLAPEPALGAGGSRALRLRLRPPAMRYASDLPRQLHLRTLGAAATPGVLHVELDAAAEAHVRLGPPPPGLPGVVPRPLQVETDPAQGSDDQGLPLRGDAHAGPLEVHAWSPAAAAAGELLRRWAAAWPAAAPLAGGGRGGGAGPRGRRLVLAEAAEAGDREWLGEEGYELFVDERGDVNIAAAFGPGFLRGAATLQQALGVAYAAGQTVFPPLRIRDRPRFGYRGLMLDVARHFFPVDFIKRTLDWMYLYKLNVFHWHLTDDEGWRFEVKALPNLTAFGAWRGLGEVVEPQYGSGPQRYGGFYSHDDVREVVGFASSRGITVVPEIDVPGHCYAAIRALPGLLGEAARRGGPASVQGFRGNVLDAASPATYVFLEAVLTEVLDVFPAQLGVHIGMDEVPPGAWSDDPAEEARLLGTLARWLQEFLRERGRALLGWEEAFRGGAGPEPGQTPRAAAFAWKEDERFAARAAGAGYDVVLCPAHFLYLDLVQGMEFADRGLYWAAPALPLERVYSYEPLERLRRLGLPEGAEGRLRGLQANLWGETVDSPERAEEMLFPRLLAVSEIAWSDASRRDWSDFQGRLVPQLSWLARDGQVRYGGVSCGLVTGNSFLPIPDCLASRST
ncbi:unnamed protein product [Prorocentrum cordatum]|uniref:beta-N-acetylhexosaminidase n=1 Tax=Prorocentrum cordatum TaxID=2364126 RepID=A0ABN9Q0H9_9DINO|nr:unnamed protein product [Polarella glacialis]